jgi:hypothetical protein
VYKRIISLASFLVISFFIQYAIADIWIPENEYVGYFDSNGIYTVVGTIKNSEQSGVIPTVIVNIQDGEKIITKSFEYPAIEALKDLPFKVKFPEINSKFPHLKNPEVTYVHAEKKPSNIQVLYDKTLKKHEDGHLTGRIINNGSTTLYNVKVFATIHGYDQVLDVGQNIEMIDKMEPGEIRSFTMYPDPSITSEIRYYSCFIPTDSTIVPVYTERNGEKFYFRYDSGSWYYDAKFNDEGTELSLKTQTSFPLETYANFEFPHFKDNEKFNVFLNGQQKKSIQSIDERGNWHVAFVVEPRESGEILISGFGKGWKPEGILIPDWIKFNSGWWAEGKIDDNDFVRGIEFLIQEDIIKISPTIAIENEQTSIPSWIRNNAGWWSDGKIDDSSFVQGIQFLIQNGIIKV